MTDPSGDEHNEPYDEGEKTQASGIRDLYERANAGQAHIQTIVKTNDEPAQEIEVNIDDLVSKYSERILIVWEIDGERVHRMDFGIDYYIGPAG